MKRIISMISALALTASLWSCNSKNPPVPEVQKNTQESIKSGQTASETSYKLTSYFDSVPFADEDKINGEITNIVAGTDSIYLFSQTMYEEDNDEPVDYLIRETDPETMQSTEKTETRQPFEYKDYFNWINEMDELKNFQEIKDLGLGNMGFCYGELKSSSGDNYYVISEKYSSPYLLKTDSSGKLVYISDQINDIGEGYAVFGMAEAPDGKIIIISYTLRGLVTVMNPETGDLEEITELNDITDIHGFAGDYLVCSDNKSIYGYSFDDESMIKFDSADENFSLRNVSVENGKIKAAYKEEEKIKNYIYRADTEGHILNSEEIEMNEDCWIHNTFVSENGDLYFILYTHGVDSEDGMVFETSKPDIYRLSADGHPEKIYDSPVLHFECWINNFFCDKNGNIYLQRDDNYDNGEFLNITEIYSSSGELLHTEKSDQYFTYYCIGDTIFAETMDGEQLNEVVFENGSLNFKKTDYKTISDMCDGYRSFIVSDKGEYDFYAANDDGSVYGYKLEDGSSYEILNWSECNEEYESNNITVLDDNTLVVMAYSKSQNENSEYYYMPTQPVFLKRADENRLAELNSRKIITAAGYSDSVPYNFKSDVKNFNKNNSEYMMHFKGYTYNYYSDSPQDQLSMDVINGFTPDILIYGSSTDEIQSLVSMNAFTDMKELINSDDTLNYDDILPSVTKLCTQNDCMYRIFPNFYINSLAAKESLAGSESGWKYSDVNKILSENPDSSFFPKYEYHFDELISSYLAENINYEEKKCSFDTEEFRELMKLLSNPEEEEYYEYNWDEEEYVPEDMQFRNNDSITYNYNEESFIGNISAYAGENAVIKGYPSSSGKPYLLIEPSTCFSVMKSSEVKEGAWKFISMYFTDEYQKDTTWSVLRKYTENGEIAIREKYKEEYGYTSEDFSVWIDDEQVIVPEPDEKTKEHIRSYMASDMAEIIYSSKVNNIIWEEAEKYFNGDQNEDTTAANVQKKVQLYLSERG